MVVPDLLPQVCSGVKQTKAGFWHTIELPEAVNRHTVCRAQQVCGLRVPHNAPSVQLLGDVLCNGCVCADAVGLHLGQQVALGQAGGRLCVALRQRWGGH